MVGVAVGAAVGAVVGAVVGAFVEVASGKECVASPIAYVISNLLKAS